MYIILFFILLPKCLKLPKFKPFVIDKKITMTHDNFGEGKVIKYRD